MIFTIVSWFVVGVVVKVSVVISVSDWLIDLSSDLPSFCTTSVSEKNTGGKVDGWCEIRGWL